VQTCVVHLIRHSLAFVSYKDRKAVAAALKQIYKAKDADAGKLALDDFAEGAQECREFRVGAMTMRAKETSYGTTQTA
jgi:putative transposase